VDFAAVASIVLPVFGLIGIGFLAARTGYMSPIIGDGLTDFVNKLGVPVLIFRTIGTAHFPDLSPWPLWATYFGGAIIAWAIGSTVATRLFRRSRAAGVIAGTSAAFSNLVMVGIPIIVSAFGEAGALPLFIILSVHLPTMMVAGTLMTEHAVRLDTGSSEPLHVMAVLAKVGRNLVTNPLVIGLLIGAIWRTAGLGLSGAPKVVVDHIAAAGLPTALIALGMAMNRYGMRGEVALSAVISICKLMVMPAAVYLIGTYVFRLDPAWVKVATIAGACPSGINAYLFAQRFNVAHAVASGTIALATAASVVTMVFWFLMIGT
jgi:predicted permease